MKIIVVCPCKRHLMELVEVIRKVYPNDEIKFFSDPFLAVKYNYDSDIDVVFATAFTGPFNEKWLAESVYALHKNAKFYCIVVSGECNDLFSGCLEWPVSEDAIRNLAE